MMDANQVILTRQLPKTGSLITTQSGEDGTYKAGWWKGRDYDTNKIRFISKTIGDNGDVITIDRATGLMWAADGNAAGCMNGDVDTWILAFHYLTTLDFAGFIDWRKSEAGQA
ncbi:unnamed protein product [marine sediment metagenome]|uniref:Uncharacterized protein n=1 Tax=marine sediment metagenome TaxID=412755 RepID=X1T8K2_9ZZZZ